NKMNNYLLGIALLNCYFLISYQQSTTVSINSTINYESIPYCDEISTFKPSNTTQSISSTTQNSTGFSRTNITFINTSPTTTSSHLTTSVSKKPSPSKTKRIFIFKLNFSLPRTSKRQSASFLSSLQLIVENSFKAEIGQNVTVSTNISSSNTLSSSVDIQVERTFVEENLISLDNFTAQKALGIMTSSRTFSQIITSSNASGLILETTQSNLRVSSVEIIENPDGSIVQTQCEPLSVSTISSSPNCTTTNTTLANTSTAKTSQFTFSKSTVTQTSISSLTTSAAKFSQSTTPESTRYQNTTTDTTSFLFSNSTGIFTTLNNTIQTKFSNITSMTSTSQSFKTTTISNTISKENSTTSTTIKTSTNFKTTPTVNTQETTIEITTSKNSQITTSLISSTSSKVLEITTSTTNTANPLTIQPTTLPRSDLIEVVTLIEISGGLSLSLSITITGRQIQIGNVNLFLLDSAIQEIIKSEFSTGGKISTKIVSGETVIVIDISSTSNSNSELGPKLKNIIESIDSNRTALKSLAPSGVVLKIDSRKFLITANQTVFVGGSKTTMTSCSKILENEMKCIKQSFDKNGNLNSTINSTINVQIAAENLALNSFENINILLNEDLNSLIEPIHIAGPTIFCLIKTHPLNIVNRKALLSFNLWARKCDNYRYTTLLPEHLRGPNYTHSETIEAFNNFYMIQPKGLVKETHDNLTFKMYNSMIYVYEKFPKYDWYYITDDDAYLNVKNLKEFLRDKSWNESITYGYNFNFHIKDGFHGGGPGFVISYAAMESIVKEMQKDIRNCPNTGTDDLDINHCIRNYNGKIGKSIDEKGRERFLGFHLMTHFKGEITDWIRECSQNVQRGGLDCCADQLIASHQKNPKDMFRLDLAFEFIRNISSLYEDYFGQSKSILIKDIIKMYLLIDDIESDQNNFVNYEKFLQFSKTKLSDFTHKKNVTFNC
ncbi:unnamed protein product, partial [Brachionus calyciflorus]